MKRFPLDQNYAQPLKSQNISVSEVLRRAELPEDLFSRKDASLTSEEYLRFMKSIGRAVQDTDIPSRLATTERIETVNPPIFAAYCSQDARHCIKRLAQYKALAGAVSFEVQEDDTGITVALRSAETDAPLPEIIVGIEMVLLTKLIRKATQEHIVPTAATVQSAFVNPAYEKFLGRTAAIAQQNSLTFSQTDAEIPFITRNDTMWALFEPELRKRLSEMEMDDTFAARVRSVLVELLPGGACGIEDVCARLCVSKHTLQRKLSEEETTFQKQLNHTRELLAKNYLENTALPSEDIAFLLGYQDVTSFFRAFAIWTGMGVAEYKAQNRNA